MLLWPPNARPKGGAGDAFLCSSPCFSTSPVAMSTYIFPPSVVPPAPESTLGPSVPPTERCCLPRAKSVRDNLPDTESDTADDPAKDQGDPDGDQNEDPATS